MDYNMNEIDIPDFKKQKKGKGAIKDFIKKHKTKIEVASGLAALSLPFLTYLAMRDNAKENKPLTEAQVMALPQRERDIQEALARERVKGTSRENLPMYPPSGGPTQKQMDDAFLESIKKSYRDRGIERFKDNGKTYFSGYVKPSAQEERKEERKESGYPSGLPPPRAPREIPPPPPKRHLGFFVVPPEIRSPVPQAIPLKPEHKAFLETKKGRGKPNKLAKQVMEYKKKHNVTLKEAWAHFK
jgi:hypothetical protein